MKKLNQEQKQESADVAINNLNNELDRLRDQVVVLRGTVNDLNIQVQVARSDLAQLQVEQIRAMKDREIAELKLDNKIAELDEKVKPIIKAVWQWIILIATTVILAVLAFFLKK